MRLLTMLTSGMFFCRWDFAIDAVEILLDERPFSGVQSGCDDPSSTDPLPQLNPEDCDSEFDGGKLPSFQETHFDAVPNSTGNARTRRRRTGSEGKQRRKSKLRGPKKWTEAPGSMDGSPYVDLLRIPDLCPDSFPVIRLTFVRTLINCMTSSKSFLLDTSTVGLASSSSSSSSSPWLTFNYTDVILNQLTYDVTNELPVSSSEEFTSGSLDGTLNKNCRISGTCDRYESTKSGDNDNNGNNDNNDDSATGNDNDNVTSGEDDIYLEYEEDMTSTTTTDDDDVIFFAPTVAMTTPKAGNTKAIWIGSGLFKEELLPVSTGRTSTASRSIASLSSSSSSNTTSGGKFSPQKPKNNRSPLQWEASTASDEITSRSTDHITSSSTSSRRRLSSPSLSPSTNIIIIPTTTTTTTTVPVQGRRMLFSPFTTFVDAPKPDDDDDHHHDVTTRPRDHSHPVSRGNSPPIGPIGGGESAVRKQQLRALSVGLIVGLIAAVLLLAVLIGLSLYTARVLCRRYRRRTPRPDPPPTAPTDSKAPGGVGKSPGGTGGGGGGCDDLGAGMKVTDRSDTTGKPRNVVEWYV